MLDWEVRDKQTPTALRQRELWGCWSQCLPTPTKAEGPEDAKVMEARMASGKGSRRGQETCGREAIDSVSSLFHEKFGHTGLLSDTLTFYSLLPGTFTPHPEWPLLLSIPSLFSTLSKTK